MDEPVKLVCPECDAAYRVKHLTLGKAYNCKKCGAPLVTMDTEYLSCPGCGAQTGPAHVDVSRRLHCTECAERPALVLGEPPLGYGYDDIVRINLAASASAIDNVEPPPPSDIPATDTSGSPRGNEAPPAAGNADSLLRQQHALEEKMRNVAERLDEREEAFTRQVTALAENIAALSTRLEADDGGEGGESVAKALIDLAEKTGGRWPEAVDVDALAGKILSGVEGLLLAGREEESPRFEPVAAGASFGQDDLAALREQVAELSRAIAGMEGLPEGRADLGDLPERVAEQVGRGIEARVVGPVTQALAKQAPEILAHIQDDKLAEVVSRSVREAQRPVLREVMSGGRGVPLWLFASLLIPLLLILGYLFLPGEFGFADGNQPTGIDQAVFEDELARLHEGLPLLAEDEERLRSIEATLHAMYENALAHVKKAGTLEAEVKNLNNALSEREKLIAEYNALLQKHSRRIRAYEIQLTRLGISPDSIPDSEGN